MKQCNIRRYAFLGELLLAVAFLIALAPGIRAAETEDSPPETPPAQEEEMPDRILNIYKSAADETGKQPLADIQIDLYQVASMEELAGELSLSEQPTQQEIQQYMCPENLIATLVTDVQGFATYNFTANNRPDGVYMVVERFNPATTGEVEPFYISIPCAGEEGEQYTIDIHLKSTIEVGPLVNVDVNAIDNDSGSFAVGQLHTWILRCGIPNGLGKAKSYILTHETDARLTRESGSMVILHTKDGRQLPLRPKEHYQLEEGKAGDGANRLRLALTPAGMAYSASNLGEGDYPPELRLSFRACINETAAMGATIPGDARLSYTNAAGVTFEAESDRPEVHTGGVHISLTDGAELPLPEATFRLARLATEGELADNSIRKELLYINGEKMQVVFASFYVSDGLLGAKVSEMNTNAEGKALAYGLPYGNYYLVETKAPSGYNRITLPVPVAINEVSHLTARDGWENMEGQIVDNTITIANTKFVLPETGGMGTALFAMVGISVIGGGLHEHGAQPQKGMEVKMRYLRIWMALLLGIGIFSYPWVSRRVNQRSSAQAVRQFGENLKETDMSVQRSLAEEYNRELLQGTMGADYEEILDISGGVMGYLKIPRIHVSLPIYHGTDEEVLRKGVGHLPQSAFPIGGEGNHTVLTGHTGLPSARLLTDLRKLETGDWFYISILGDTLSYQVEEIQTVLPEEAEALTPVPGEDQCTLVTCTPYGINSHRLLVMGKRAENKSPDER